MKFNVEGRTIHVNENIVDAFAQIPRQLTNNSIRLLLKMDGVKIDTLSDNELEKVTNEKLLEELKELEYLSRPEMVQAAIDFANRQKG